MKLDITSWPRWWEKDNGTHHEMDFVQFVKKLGEHRMTLPLFLLARDKTTVEPKEQKQRLKQTYW